jgi:hypothetical protein
VPDTDTLTFRVTARQHRTVLLASASFLAVTAALAAIGLLTPVPDMVRFYALTIAAALLIASYVYASYARCYTECTPQALRMRAYGRRREWPWAQVTGIAVGSMPRSTSSSLVVTLRNGRQFRPSLPVSGGVTKDADFEASAQKVIEYWRRSAGPDPALAGQRQEHRDGPGATIYRWVAISLLSLFLTAALATTLVEGGIAWAAHLGAGQSGYFTAVSSCGASCGWNGTFTGPDGSITYGVSMNSASIAGPGSEVRAEYLADHIYPPDGGSGWIGYTVGDVAELGVLYVIIHFWRRHRRRRKAAAMTAAPLCRRRPGRVPDLAMACAAKSVLDYAGANASVTDPAEVAPVS